MTPLWRKLLSEVSFDPEDGKQRLHTIPALAGKYCSFTEKELQEITACRDAVLKDPLLLKNWTMVRQVFSRIPSDAVLAEPFPAEFYGKLPQETFLLLIAIACIPDGERIFQEKNLPPDKLYESFDAFQAWVGNCERSYGVTGLEYDHGFAWIVLRLLPGIVLRFGRLEYNQSRFFSDLLVFRRKGSGEICVLVNGDYPVTDKGLIAVPPEEAAFHTVHPFACFETWEGYRVSPDGRIRQEKVLISSREWERILAPYDPVLYLHIPELGPLKQEQVLQSLKAVKEYYQKNCGFQPKAIVSGSWLFDPVLQDLLPETSNLRKFQETGFLLPSRGGKSDAVRRIFGYPAVKNGVESVEWKTSLQKSLGAYLKDGGICRGGRYLHLF